VLLSLVILMVEYLADNRKTTVRFRTKDQYMN
jgi:hypothetical protein